MFRYSSSPMTPCIFSWSLDMSMHSSSLPSLSSFRRRTVSLDSSSAGSSAGTSTSPASSSEELSSSASASAEAVSDAERATGWTMTSDDPMIAGSSTAG